MRGDPDLPKRKEPPRPTRRLTWECRTPGTPRSGVGVGYLNLHAPAWRMGKIMKNEKTHPLGFLDECMGHISVRVVELSEIVDEYKRQESKSSHHPNNSMIDNGDEMMQSS